MSATNHRAFWRACLPALLSALLAPAAWGAYKIVGPDGRVTYTDRPPVGEGAQALGKSRAGVSTVALPYELQQVVNRHPVTLYTMRECGACASGRQLLQSRGVPYTEKTVDTPEDVRAFNAQENSTQLPLLKVGGKQIIGLQQSEWNAYLDAAGYPQQSKLPPGYTQPEASPLAPPKPASSPAGDRRNESDRPFAPTIGNPPEGFRF
ncbi:glutaredoxin family protein [Aquabacterium sp. UBA2148]|uniref:glutaredoxin family protein n=1 Tax=Aquabacterium sp. UBA2148 TaxID=1946042 RepID=UPI00257DE886|nr:glutaredoxin family protein [Aquabacterium sp. UBA2148]